MKPHTKGEPARRSGRIHQKVAAATTSTQPPPSIANPQKAPRLQSSSRQKRPLEEESGSEYVDDSDEENLGMRLDNYGVSYDINKAARNHEGGIAMKKPKHSQWYG